MEETEVEHCFQIALGQWLIECDENNAVLDDIFSETVGEEFLKNLQKSLGIILVGTLADADTFFDKFAHLLQLIFVERNAELFQLDDVVEHYKFVYDLVLCLFPPTATQMRNFIERYCEFFLNEAEDGTPGVIDEVPFLLVGLDAWEIKFDGDVGNLFDNFGYFEGIEQFALQFGAGVLIEVLHHRFEQPGVDFKFLECLWEVKNFVDIPDFGDPFRDQLVLLVKLANVLEVVPHFVLIDIFECTFGAQAVLEGGLDEGVAYFDLFLHVFGDGVLEGGEFHVDLDDVVVGEVQQFVF